MTPRLVGKLVVNLPWPTVTGNHYKTFNYNQRRVFVTAKGRAYRLAVRAAVLSLPMPVRRLLPIAGRFDLEIVAAPPDRRVRDKDNVEKTLFDACTLSGLWVDDKNIADKIHLDWLAPVPGGCVTLHITPRADERKEAA